MSAGAYALAVARVVIIVAGAVVTAANIRAWLAPRWLGALRLLADVVGALGLVIVVSEALGSVGLFTRTMLVTVLGVLGAGSAFAVRTRHRGGPWPAAPVPMVDLVPMAAATGLVVAQWTSWVADRVT